MTNNRVVNKPKAVEVKIEEEEDEDVDKSVDDEEAIKIEKKKM
jgi:hypothetical protein